MKKYFLTAALLALSGPLYSQEEAEGAASPNEIINAAPRSDWVKIAPESDYAVSLGELALDQETQISQGQPKGAYENDPYGRALLHWVGRWPLRAIGFGPSIATPWSVLAANIRRYRQRADV